MKNDLDQLIYSLKDLNKGNEISTNQLLELYVEAKDFLNAVEHSTDKTELSINLNSLVFKHEKKLASEVRSIISEYTNCITEYSANHNKLEDVGIIAGSKLIESNEKLETRMNELQNTYKISVCPDVSAFIQTVNDRPSILQGLYESLERTFKFQKLNDYGKHKQKISLGRKKIRNAVYVVATLVAIGFAGNNIYTNLDSYKTTAIIKTNKLTNYLDKKINGTQEEQVIEKFNDQYRTALNAFDQGNLVQADSLIQDLKKQLEDTHESDTTINYERN